MASILGGGGGGSSEKRKKSRLRTNTQEEGHISVTGDLGPHTLDVRYHQSQV